MRILMVSERLPPSIGGVERHVAGLADELTRRGHRLTLVAPAHAPDLPAEDDLDGVRLYRSPHRATRRHTYLAAWRWWLANRVLIADADVIHFHEVYALLHVFGPARLLCRGKPLYLTYHGYEMRHPVPPRAQLYRRWAARQIDGSLAVGHFLDTWFHVAPGSVTYGAVTAASPEATLSLEATPNLATGLREAAPPRAVFVGRLAADTRADLYLRGLVQLERHHGLRLPLDVCGDGDERQALTGLARREGLDVTFHGWVEDPMEYVARASLAFAPGYLAMLEAMALRRPVFVVYDNPIKEDYYRRMPHAAKLFQVADAPERLAEQMAAAIEGRHDLEPQLERARRFAEDHNWARLADTYLELWGGKTV